MLYLIREMETTVRGQQMTDFHGIFCDRVSVVENMGRAWLLFCWGVWTDSVIITMDSAIHM